MNHFPNLHEATLDLETLQALFNDVVMLGEDVEAIPKRRSRIEVGSVSFPLEEAFTALRDRTVQALQLRYNYQGHRWCDTIVPAPSGWRLTRIDLAEAASIGAD